MNNSDNDSRRKLYDALSSTYDLGSFEEFNKKMDSPVSRQKLYNAVSSTHDLGPYAEYERKIGGVEDELEKRIAEAKNPPTPVSAREAIERVKERVTNPQPTPTPAQQPAAKPNNWTGNNTGIRVPFATPEDTRTYEQQKVEENVAKFQQETQPQVEALQERVDSFHDRMEQIRKANEPFADNSVQRFNPETGKIETRYLTKTGEEVSTPMEQAQQNKEIDNAVFGPSLSEELQEAYNERERLEQEISARTSAIDKANNPSYAQMLAATEGGYNPIMEARSEDPELSMLWAAKRNNDDRIKTLEREQNKDGFFKTLFNDLTSLSTWTGMLDLKDAATLLQYGDKKLEGVTGEAQKAMLENLYKEQMAQSKYGENDTAWQKYGDITAQMIPFVLEFILTGGGYGAISEAGARLGGKAASKIAAKNIAGKVGHWIVKNTGVLAGDFGASLLMANTTGGARTAADILARHQGQIVEDGEGGYKFEGGKNWGRSVYEGEMAATLEYFTEKGGRYFDKIGGSTGKWIGKGLDKIGAGRVTKLFSNIRNSEWNKYLSKVAINDLLSEGLEEEANIILNSMLVGDNKFSDLFDGQTQADIWGGMMVSIGFMKSPGVIGAGVRRAYNSAQYHNYNHRLETSDGIMSFRLGDAWTPLRERIDNTTNEDMHNVVIDVVNSEELNTIQKEGILSYIGNLMQMRGYNLRTAAEAKDKINSQLNTTEVGSGVNAQNTNINETTDTDIDAEAAGRDVEQRNAGGGVRNGRGEAVSSEQSGAAVDDGIDIGVLQAGISPERLGDLGEVSGDRAEEVGHQIIENAKKNAAYSRGYNADAEERQNIVIDYAEATDENRAEREAAMLGMRKKIEDDADYYAAMQKEALAKQQHKKADGTLDGTIQPATLNNNNEVYIIEGEALLAPNGQGLDILSDDVFVVYDPVENKNKEVSQKDIVSLGTILNTTDEEERIERERQAMIQAEMDAAEGKVNVEVGKSVTLPDGTEGTIIAINGDDVVVELPDEKQTQVSTTITELQQAADERAMERYNLERIAHEDVGAPAEEEGVPETLVYEGVPEEYKEGMVLIVRDEDTGTIKNLTYTGIRAKLTSDGTDFEEAENGRYAVLIDNETGNPVYIAKDKLDEGVVGYEMPINALMEGEDNALEDEGALAEGAPEDNAIEDEGVPEMPMRKGRKGNVSSPDWYAVTPERAHAYIFNELGFTPDMGRELVRNNANAVAKSMNELLKKKPQMGTNPLAYTAAVEKHNEKLQTLQQQAEYWENVKAIQQGIEDAERRRKNEEAKAAREAERLRMEAEAEEIRRKKEAEVARQAEELTALTDLGIGASTEETVAKNTDIPEWLGEKLKAANGNRKVLLQQAIDEMGDNPYALEVLENETPQTLEEVVASLLTGGTKETKLRLMLSDENVGGAVIRGLGSMTGYTQKDINKFPFLFAKRENGGISVDELGEKVLNEARDEGVVFDTNDAMAGTNAVQEFFGQISSQGDINDYILRNRISKAEEVYRDTIIEIENRFIEDHDGLTRAEYEAWEQMVEELAAVTTNESYEEIYNLIYNTYDRRDETDDGGSRSESLEEAERPESTSPQNEENDDRGTDAGGQRTQGESTSSSPSPIAEAIAQQEINENPTEGQKKAGNYKKPHVRVDGFDVTIENKKGGVRSGVDPNGKAWSQTMNNDYGYILDTEGVDGDHIDLFLSDTPEQGDVFVVDQVDPTTGEFDEHKVMYGFPDMESARQAYLANYEEGWQGLGAITPVSKEEFKKWIKSSHRKTKPFSEYKSVETLGDVMVERQPKSAADVEAGGAVVDKLQSMGINVSTDIAENRKVRKQAEQDNSEAGKIHDLKTSDGKVYGFTYRGGIYLDPRKIDAELPLHEYGHLWTEAYRILNPEGWKDVVETIKQDVDGWNMVKELYPDLKTDSEIADEVIATFSGKNGAEKLKAELERMAAKNPDYKSRWGNIYQNIIKAIQDFWKKIGDFLGIKYETPEQVYDQVLKDFAAGMNPRARVEEYLKERDEAYMQAAESGDVEKATEIFNQALSEEIGNGMTPFVAVGKYSRASRIPSLAHKIKSRDPKVIAEVADMIAPLIPENAVLVPAPSHGGVATDMLDLAKAVAEIKGCKVADVLMSAPRESQYKTKKESGQPITADQMGIVLKNGVALEDEGVPVVIDNVVDSGNTAEACIKALGKGLVVSLGDAADMYGHAVTLKSAAPILKDKDGKIIPLSKRFDLSGSRYLGKPQMQKAESELQKPTKEQKELVKGLTEWLNGIGIPTHLTTKKGQEMLDKEREHAQLQKRLASLSDAEKFIEESLQGKHRGQRFEVELTKATEAKIRRAVGRDFDSHNIYANGIVHSRKNHGENGEKLTENSIPLRDEDFKLAPYIMVAPDRVRSGSMAPDGRESIRFEKDLSNGVVLVVEKEQKNSPDDMDTITMWADLSSRGVDARSEKRPLLSTSTPANNDLETSSKQPNAVTVITSFDAAKIRKDAETAIEKDEKISLQKGEAVPVFYSNAAKAVEGIKQGQPMFYKTEDGEVYGFTLGGEIYIDPRYAKADTPIHEYTHLWADALEKNNPEAFARLTEVMRTAEDGRLWEYVSNRYPELTDKPNELVKEVFAHYSGKRGNERLEAEMREEMAKADGIFEKAQVANIFHRLRDLLNRFWNMARDLFAGKVEGVEKLSAEDFADMTLAAFANKFDPRSVKGAEEEKTLMGVHNISEDKLRKALKNGGFANPSMAVIDTKKGGFDSYGNISLIPRSSIIDAETGRNAGTYSGDAYTPTYPNVEYHEGEETEKKLQELTSSLPQSLGEYIRRKVSDYMDGNTIITGLEYLFLKERGIDMPIVHNERRYPGISRKEINERIGVTPEDGSDTFYGSDLYKEYEKMPEDQRFDFNLWLEKYGDEEEIAKVKDIIERLLSEDKDDAANMLAERFGKLMPFNLFDTLVYNVSRDEREAGEENLGRTVEDAAIEIDKQGLRNEFEEWKQKVIDGLGYEEKLFAGYTPSGTRKYLPNTAENASKLMNRQEDTNSGNHTGLNATRAALLYKMHSLDDIRKHRNLLIGSYRDNSEQYEEMSGKLLDIAHQLSDMQKIDDNPYTNTDYAIMRMQEAFTKKDPITYLNKEYGYSIDKDSDFAKQMLDFIEEVKDLPVKYFETKFKRPVMLDEFAVAVVPEGTSQDVVDALKNAGLDVRTYDGTPENRQAVTLDAVRGRDDIMFQKVGGDENDNREVNIVGAEKEHGFKNFDEANKWARKNIVGGYENPEIGSVNISGTAIDKYLSEKAVSKSDNKDVHLSALKVMPSIIENSIVGEVHDDNKGNSNIKDIVRLYGAIDIDGNIYRVKTTVKRYNDRNTKSKAYTYEVTEIELLEGFSGTSHTQSADSVPTSNNSISAAKLLNNSETAKNNLQEVENEEREEGALMRNNALEAEGEPAMTYEEALASARRAGYSKKQHEEYVKRMERNARKQFADFVEKLGLSDKVDIVDDANGSNTLNRLNKRQQKAKGWYDPNTDRITIVLNNHHSKDDVLTTILHEGVAHYGLRALFGKNFDNFLYNVYYNASEAVRDEIIDLAKNKYHYDFLTATEEYLARLAESTDFTKPENQSWWTTIKKLFWEMMHKLGLEVKKMGLRLTDNELRYLLWRSYKNLTEPGRFRSFADRAEDAVMKDKLKVGDFEESQPTTPADNDNWWEKSKVAEEMSLKEFENAVKASERKEGSFDNPNEGEIFNNMYWQTVNYLEDDNVSLEDAVAIEASIIEEASTIDSDTPRYQELKGMYTALGPWIEAMEEWESYNAVSENKPRFRDDEDASEEAPRHLGLRERVTQSMLGIAEQNKEDSTKRDNAVKAINANISDLLKAMREQRTYDRNTVKRVSDLVQVLMQYGYLEDLGKGENKRLISAIKNATGKEDISKEVQTVMDIMVDNQLKNAEKQLHQMETIKGSKVDAKGVEVQGALDVAGQTTIKAFKNSRNMLPEALEEAIANARERIGSDNKAIADEAANRYVGLMFAQEYIENIKESEDEEKQLRQSIKDYDGPEDSKKEFVESVKDAIRQNKIERVEAYTDLMTKMSGLLGESITKAEAFKQAEVERVREIQHNANSDMEGRELKGHQEEEKIIDKPIVRLVLSPLANLDQMMREFGRNSINGMGYLWNRYVRGWVDAADNEQLMKERYRKLLDDKAAEIFGKRYGFNKLYRYAEALPKSTVEYWDGAAMRPHDLSQAQLLYLYAVEKMPRGKVTNRRMGLTDDVMEAIEKHLDPKLKAYADWVQTELLPKLGKESNEVYRRMFGANMDDIENYFPFKRDPNAIKRNEENGNQNEDDDRITTVTKAVKKRTGSTAIWDIPNCNFFDVLAAHVNEMSHWNNFAELNRDFGTLLSYNRFKQQVMNMHSVNGGTGKGLWERLKKVAAITTDSYSPKKGETDELSTRMAKNITMSRIALRVSTAIKQITSLPAFAGKANPLYTAENILTLGVPAVVWSWNNMPNFRKRLTSRTMGEYRLQDTDYDKYKKIKSVKDAINIPGNIFKFIGNTLGKYGMIPNIGVDALTIAIGSHAVYRTAKDKYIKRGMSKEQAERKAIQDAEIAFNESQQSSEGPFLAPVQVDRTFAAVKSMAYRNSSTSYTRETVNAARNLKRLIAGDVKIDFAAKQLLRELYPEKEDNWSEEEWNWARKEATKERNKSYISNLVNLTMFGWGLPFLWRYFSQLYELLVGGDDDDKKKIAEESAVLSLSGPLEGLFYGDVLADVVSHGAGFTDEPWRYIGRSHPALSELQGVLRDMDYDRMAAISDVVSIFMSMTTGADPKVIGEWVLAVEDVCKGDEALTKEAAIFFGRLLNYPQKQIDNVYFEELGLTGEEASHYTPEQLAKRYAEYKVKRGHMFTPWVWDDEDLIEKQQNKAEKKIKERAERFGEDISNLEEEFKEMDEKVKEANKEKDYVKKAEMWEKIHENEDEFEKYEDFKALDKQLDNLVKEYLAADTPEEAEQKKNEIIEVKQSIKELE